MIFFHPTHFRHSVGALCEIGRWDHYDGEWYFEGHHWSNGSTDVPDFSPDKQVSHNVGLQAECTILGMFIELTASNYVMTSGKPFLRVALGTSLLCLTMCLCIGMLGMWWTTTFRQGEQVSCHVSGWDWILTQVWSLIWTPCEPKLMSYLDAKKSTFLGSL